MVPYKAIKASNALINDSKSTAPRIAVFVGATSGIGQLTASALVATGTRVRIYLIGRKSSKERAQNFIQELHSISLKAEVIWTEGEASILGDVKRVCDIIKSKEKHVDLLFLTAGYVPFVPRDETAEGVEVTLSLRYYSRMMFILQLLPLLRQAKAARVISVLGGGLLERPSIDLDDLDLKKPGSFGAMQSQVLSATMNTAALERLAADSPSITFIHSCPGSVDTGNVRRGFEPDSLKACVQLGESISGTRRGGDDGGEEAEDGSKHGDYENAYQ
ncbi:short chain dehydrogenase/reductase family protein [Emericellopsis cladophorae]|uniref:Short chain dehydrogenase/reductase family protein n=1 Tax=Emericellopsis cladophorae TaxID=2686198 RepID=A0A9Q0BH47_9HYPO|nr:short chain dehydrogenase/reductase family protein [Emericellopsis cladophorae]KAI6784039.1 short chain dehydrogenase/reductase family protein [Emericellopsis cladophorae]